MNPTKTHTHTPFSHPQTLPLCSVAEIIAEPVLVVAPHPDDETLGCAGAIALLRLMGSPVHILVMSDGTQSHPHSRQYPKAALQQLRAAETRAAMAILGVEESCITFLGLPDGAMPTALAPGFSAAVDRCQLYLASITPQLVLLPWRHDPHPDHRATWQILDAALARLAMYPRSIEYPIWDWVHWLPRSPDYPLAGDEVHDSFLNFVPIPLQHLQGRSNSQYRLDLFARSIPNIV